MKRGRVSQKRQEEILRHYRERPRRRQKEIEVESQCLGWREDKRQSQGVPHRISKHPPFTGLALRLADCSVSDGKPWPERWSS